VDIFDRLGSFIEGLLDDDQSRNPGSRAGADPDFSAAWAELDDYLRDETDEPPRPSFEQAEPSGVPAHLRRDFRNLEVPVGTPLSEVKKAHKKLMTAFHPDRHSGDPAKQATATKVTQRLNESYSRIRAYYEGGTA
jgi:DnaJ-domain-containing protein 1